MLRFKISPALHPGLLDVNFIPVINKNNPLLHVVNLSLPALVNTVYYVKNQEDNSCFLYCSKKGNVSLNFNQVRLLAIDLTEKRLFPLSY